MPNKPKDKLAFRTPFQLPQDRPRKPRKTERKTEVANVQVTPPLTGELASPELLHILSDRINSKRH